MRDNQAKLEELGAVVLLVTFGTPEQARRWLEETGAPFPMLLDPDAIAYRAYGLKRSFWRVLHPQVFLAYFRLLAQGRKLRSVQGDPYQLGGDFIVDSQQIVRYAHLSANPADRPDIQALLSRFP